MKKIALILLCAFPLSLSAMEKASEQRAISIMNIMPDGRIVLFSDGSESIESPDFFYLLGKPFPEPSNFNLRDGLEPIFEFCEDVLREGRSKLPKDVFEEAGRAIARAKTKKLEAFKVALSKEPYYEAQSVWVPKEVTEKNPASLEEHLCSTFTTSKGFYSGSSESDCSAYMDLVDHAAAMAGLAQDGPNVIGSSLGEQAKSEKDHSPARILAVSKSLQGLLDNFRFKHVAKPILRRHFREIKVPPTSLRSLLIMVAQNHEKFTSIDRVENRYVFETATHRNEIIISRNEASLADSEYRTVAISKILANFFDSVAISNLNESSTCGLARYLVRDALPVKGQWAWEDKVLSLTSKNSTCFYYFPEKIIRTIEGLRLDEKVVAQLIALLEPHKI